MAICASATFVITADGYARSDGVVILYLQRAKDAKRCYATVVKAESKQIGNQENGYAEISSSNVSNILEHFYSECNIDVKEVDYVEAYGCAKKVIINAAPI